MLDVESGLSDRARSELEHFFLSATLFTGKEARIIGWQDGAAAESYLRSKTI